MNEIKQIHRDVAQRVMAIALANSFPRTIAQLEEQQAQALADAFPFDEKERWVSLEERLPAEETDVLILSGTTTEIAHHQGLNWYSDDCDLTWKPTHWMKIPPLPPPPMEGK